MPPNTHPELLDQPAQRPGAQPSGAPPQGQPPAPAENAHPISRGKVALVLLLLAILVAAVAVVGYVPRRNQTRAATTAASEERSAVPVVTAAKVVQAPRDSEFVLPGSISAIEEASIYARAAGYVRKYYVDIGDRVKSGQLMAEIETPDFDQQVAQTRAALAQARQQLSQTQAALVQAQAQRDLAKVTWDRYDNLVKRGAVARQDADQQQSTYKTSEALVNAQQANVNASEENVRQAQANLDRMVTLQEYQNVRAPFDGVVTARNIDTGYLISATGGGQGAAPINVPGAQAASASGNEMFRVAQIGTLRIVVDVPQSNTADIAIGMPADVLVQQLPGRVFREK